MSSCLATIWTMPLASRKSTKTTAPWSLRRATHPASVTRCPAWVPRGEPGQKLVGCPLRADGRLRPVTREHDGLVRQRQADPGKAIENRPVIAAGQVGAADRAREQQVASEDRLRQPERDRAWGVPWRMIDHQADPGQLQRDPVGELAHVIGLGEGEPAE